MRFSLQNADFITTANSNLWLASCEETGRTSFIRQNVQLINGLYDENRLPVIVKKKNNIILKTCVTPAVAETPTNLKFMTITTMAITVMTIIIHIPMIMNTIMTIHTPMIIRMHMIIPMHTTMTG